MAFRFTPGSSSPYAPGRLLLGSDPHTGSEVGIGLEKHALTIAGSGSGKGTSVIIPNLLRWPSNALVIDPGGGNVRATWAAREAMGQEVHVIDPTRLSVKPDKNNPGVPPRLLKSFNPLEHLRRPEFDENGTLKNPDESLTYHEDMGVIADGLIMRHDPRHAHWDDSGRDILEGVADFILSTDNKKEHTLISVREALLQTPKELTAFFNRLSHGTDMQRAAASIVLGEAKKGSKELFQNAVDNTKWLSYPAIQSILSSSTCNLLDLKTKDCTVYLVIDGDLLEQHGRFLRLFVRVAISAMARGEEGLKDCLFILDEFFALGKIDSLQKAAGQMRKNGVHLWPILQDISQIYTLYGREGGSVFLTQADVLTFFGLDQDEAAQIYVSNRIGKITPDEAAADIPEPPKPHSRFLWGDQSAAVLDARARASYEARRNRYSHKMRAAGSPRVTPEEVAALTGKGEGDKVARSMIAISKAGAVFNLRLRPYFAPAPARAPATAPERKRGWLRRFPWLRRK